MPPREALPHASAPWKRSAEEHGVLKMNICDLENFDSASKIKDRQFFALRALWQVHPNLVFGYQLFDERFYKDAQEFLGEKRAWRDYLKHIKNNVGSNDLRTTSDIGTFSLVRYNQMLASLSPMADPKYDVTSADADSTRPKVVLSPSPISHRTRGRQPIPARPGTPQTPTPMPDVPTEEELFNMTEFNTPLREIEESSLYTIPRGSNFVPSRESPAKAAENSPSEDEQIVNMALILFLDSVTIYHSKVIEGGSNSPRWTIKRLQLEFGKRKVMTDGQLDCVKWVARTDGYLRMASDKDEVRAILETKPFVRNRRLAEIQKQETAQMAAWIFKYPDDIVFGSGNEGRPFRRLLISQDCFEIYLTVASYGSDYVKYLQGDEQATLGEPSFMIMKQYGPWSTKNYEHMDQLGALILAFTLQQSSRDSFQEDPFPNPGTGDFW